MSEVLVQFDEPQRSADGRMFTAEVHGSRLPTGLWEAWIEFHPRVGGEPLRTPRETEQLSRGDLRFWAAGITRAHLIETLARALARQEDLRAGGVERPGDLDHAAETLAITDRNSPRRDTRVPDPFAIYRRSGEYVLRQELRAMDAAQLADVITAHAIKDMDVIDLARTYEDALAERIVAAVQHNVQRDRAISPLMDSRATK